MKVLLLVVAVVAGTLALTAAPVAARPVVAVQADGAGSDDQPAEGARSNATTAPANEPWWILPGALGTAAVVFIVGVVTTLRSRTHE